MVVGINGNYDSYGSSYAERMREKQDVRGAERAGETAGGAEAISSGTPSEPRDEYIGSGKSGAEPTGLYWVGQDEDGKRTIFFDKNLSKKGTGDKGPKAEGDNQEKPAEICVGSTDKVDQEIKKLKEEKQELERQIQSVPGDEKKIRQLEKKLAQIEQELSRKDNDTYRRQHTAFSKTI